jgi:hypothetical protein
MYQDSLDANVRAFYNRTKAETNSVDISPKSFWENAVLLSIIIIFLTSSTLLGFFIWIFTS